MKMLAPPPPGKILGIYTVEVSQAYYRCMVPLSVIPGATWQYLGSLTEEYLEAAETIHWITAGGELESVQKFLRSLRDDWGIKRIIVDYDDALFIPHPISDVQLPPSMLEGVRYILAHADQVIVQNQLLTEHFRAYVSKDCPVSVIPNYIIPETWDHPSTPTWPPTIVIGGSPSHGLDWEIVTPALRALREQIPDVRIRLLGCCPGGFRGLYTEAYPWSSPEQYIRRLRGGAIGLCPLPRTEFNRHKSPVKAIEYSLAAKMAVIGSPTQYSEILSEGRGIIVEDDDAIGWAKAIDCYLADPHLRRISAEALYNYVIETFSVWNHVDTIRSIFI